MLNSQPSAKRAATALGTKRVFSLVFGENISASHLPVCFGVLLSQSQPSGKRAAAGATAAAGFS